MNGLMIDREKLARMVSDYNRQRDEAFASFGAGYVYEGSSSEYTRQRKLNALLTAGCHDELVNILSNYYKYVAADGKDRFEQAHDAAKRWITMCKPGTHKYYLAQGVEMAYATVLNSCLVTQMDLVSSVGDKVKPEGEGLAAPPLEEQIAAAEGQKQVPGVGRGAREEKGL